MTYHTRIFALVVVTALSSAIVDSADAGSRSGRISDFQGAHSSAFQSDHRWGSIAGYRAETAFGYARHRTRKTINQAWRKREGRHAYKKCAQYYKPRTWKHTRCMNILLEY